MSWLDLHMHTHFSDDGTYSPEELMELCAQSGVRVAAVSDHNCTRGIARTVRHARSLGIECIPAVELDCTYQGIDLHLLGYWIDPDHPGFSQTEQAIQKQEQLAGEQRIQLAYSMGFQFDAEPLRREKGGIVTGEMIAEAALVQDPENPALLPYRPGGARSDNPYVNIYWDFFSQGKPGYVPVAFQSLEGAVALVRSAGGLPVLAHPGNNIHEDTALLHGIVEQGVRGIEAYSSYHSPEQVTFYVQQAEMLSVAVSCGSDFHGKIKPGITLGGFNCGGQEAELLRGLQEALQKLPPTKL